MNPDNPDSAQEIYRTLNRKIRDIKGVDVVICPPFAYLGLFKKSANKNVYLGVQDVSFEEKGSFTGEVGANMVSSMGEQYAIIGHSERRNKGETDAVVAKKVHNAVKSGLVAIVCVGEKERDASGAYFEFIKNQIRNSLAGFKPADLKSLVIAYEPVWAIGKSFKDAMKPSEIHEMSIFIKKVLADLFGKYSESPNPILYGGSVNYENAGQILKEGNVDGLLVGRESLDPENFAKLLKVADLSR